MVAEKETIHICPKQRPFLKILENKFETTPKVDLIVSYQKIPIFGIGLISIFKIFLILKRNNNALRYFHSVPLLLLFFLKLLGVLGRHRLFFWGQEFYDHFLPIDFLNKDLKRSYKPFFFLLIRFKLYLVKDAGEFVDMPYLNFRWMRFIFWKIYASNLPATLVKDFPYDQPLPKEYVFHNAWKDERALTVLISHSGSPSIDLSSTAEVLALYAKRWNTKIAVRAFLSYSGGGKLGRDKIEKKILALFEFADSVIIERDYLNHPELVDRLRCVDIAVFYVWRDEGLTLLRHLYYCGGKLFFPKGSVNLSYFRFFFRDGCGDLDELLRSDPKYLKKGWLA